MLQTESPAAGPCSSAPPPMTRPYLAALPHKDLTGLNHLLVDAGVDPALKGPVGFCGFLDKMEGSVHFRFKI